MPLRRTIYPVTPTLSVDGFQDKLIADVLATIADSPVGVEGRVVSPTLVVVALALDEANELFPAASRAITV